LFLRHAGNHLTVHHLEEMGKHLAKNVLEYFGGNGVLPFPHAEIDKVNNSGKFTQDKNSETKDKDVLSKSDSTSNNNNETTTNTQNAKGEKKKKKKVGKPKREIPITILTPSRDHAQQKVNIAIEDNNNNALCKKKTTTTTGTILFSLLLQSFYSWRRIWKILPNDSPDS